MKLASFYSSCRKRELHTLANNYVHSMVPIFCKLCTITSRIKGDHVYRSNPKINAMFYCAAEPGNTHSPHAIIVRMKNGASSVGDKQKDDGTTVGHIPDELAEVLF